MHLSSSTVEPVCNDHLRDPILVVVVERWVIGRRKLKIENATPKWVRRHNADDR